MTKYRFGTSSNACLDSAHTAWREILTPVLDLMDIAVVCGHRGKEDQDQAYFEGRSQLRWPDSKHNSLPSLAVDVLPPPYNYISTPDFYLLAGMIKMSARQLGYKIVWGGEWKRFKDYAHFELQSLESKQ